MSESSEDAEKKKKAESSQQQQPPAEAGEQKKKEETPGQTSAEPAAVAKPARPVIGTPVGRPTVGTPVGRPTVGTPIGKPVGTNAVPPSSVPPTTPPASTATPRPVVGRPSVGTPSVGTQRPVGAPAPSVASGSPSIPQKKPIESKQDISRRNFVRGLAVLGGLVAIGQFAALGPFLQGSVAGQSESTQVIKDAKTGEVLTTSSIAENDWRTFIWPYTGNPNVDNDTFSQCVVIHLPKGLTAPADVSAKDPKTGDVYVAFSRVCVHLWCLWSYVPGDRRMECPCHGSQYVPGTGTYPDYPTANNQPPGQAVGGPAYLQVPPNNQLPIVLLSINSSNGELSAKGLVGQIGCGQKC